MTYLTLANLIPYLLDNQYLSYQMVVAGDVAAQQMLGRNTSFYLKNPYDKDLFIKQAEPSSPINAEFMKKEAYTYQILKTFETYKAFSPYLPHLYNYDPQQHLLVIEAITGTKNLYEFYLQQKTFSPEIAELQAFVLAAYQVTIPTELYQHEWMQVFPAQLPSIFSMFQPEYAEPYHNAASKEIIELMRSQVELVQLVRQLRQEWQISTLIHGDVKWNNFLVKQENNALQLWLIDWEMSDVGDPLWDVAGAIQSYLSGWILSLDKNNALLAEPLPEMDFMQLEHMQASAGAFWEAYVKHRQFTNEEKTILLEKTLRYTALRLIQTNWENSVFTGELSANNMRLLQFSMNLLKQPNQFIQPIFG